ncbi:MAG: HDIG domain-containing protein [Leptospiraceae bacterium]|nr:HDIG domain-containing protein [Leptospiraceae bacterium]MCB1303764.1 HDIG domain-containing protein [Leptospiraceae bacterium]
MFSFQAFFRSWLVRISDFLTATRPASFVRRLQLGLLCLTVLILTMVLSYPVLVQKTLRLGPEAPFAAGKPSPETIVATTDIQFTQEEQFALAREDARKNAPLHFVRDLANLGPDGELQKQLRSDLQAVQKCRIDHSEMDARRICVRSGVRIWRESGLNRDQWKTILEYRSDYVEKQIQQLANLVYQEYIILQDYPESSEFKGSLVSVRDIQPGSAPTESTLPAEQVIRRNLLVSRNVLDQVRDIASKKLQSPGGTFREVIVQLTVHYLYYMPPARFDAEATEQARAAAAGDVKPPVYRLKKGEVLVQKGDVLTQEKYRALQFYNEARNRDRIGRISALFIQQVLLVVLLLYLSMRFARHKLDDVSGNLMLYLLVWAFGIVLFAALSHWNEQPGKLDLTYFFGSYIPIGFFVVLIALIFGEILALIVGCYLGFLVFIASNYDGNSLLIAFSSALIAGIMGARIKNRLHFITTGLTISFVGCIIVVAGYLYSQKEILAGPEENTVFSMGFLQALRTQILSGLSTILAMAVLPVFETLFNVPTRFKLVELADSSNFLLQELFRKAPSTWTHTLMVAALAEKACERLGLNTLLVRTGVYYHDIGKMKRAGFFVENQHLIPREENIDKNNPQKAARVIIDHVLDGITMARQARLPREVIAFIPEHHGTSTMSFFYHKALEKMKRKVNREDFRYPGPCPQSRETGIVMIADSLEAASRSLDDYSEAALDHLIQKIINIKMSENQLDESGLTLGDLQIVKQAFKEVLQSSYHFRPKYPNSADTKKLENRRTTAKKKTTTAKKKG